MKAKALEILAPTDLPAWDDVPEIRAPALVSAADLYRGQLAMLRPLFEGLLWDGLTLFIAKAKSGKSWLALQVAVAVAGGAPLRGVVALDSGPVLYGAFEEPAARTMARLRRVAPVGEWADRLHFVYELLPLMGGGAEQLESAITNLNPRLIVLDTLTALLKGGGKRENDVFRSQYAEVSCVRKLAEEHKTAVLLIHHTRKGLSEGAVEAVAGTGGIAAAADTLWHLKRKPEGEATLEIIGRETEERTLALRFDQDPIGWQVLGDDERHTLSVERRQLLELLEEDGPLSPAQIATELGRSKAGIRQLLRRMRTDGQVRKQDSKYIPSLSLDHGVTEKGKE
jgi:biotin operon repressor